MDILCAGSLPPAFYCYGICKPADEQFLANADAVETDWIAGKASGVGGRPHGFGCRENWFDAYDAFLADVFSNP